MSAPALEPIRGRRLTIEWIPVGELWIDESYQRSTDTNASKRLIETIAARWDWDVCDVLKVSRRPDDELFVIDGQHRLAGAMKRGDIPDLPCVVKRCASPPEEARLFITANRQRKAMSRLDDFRAAIGAGDEGSIAIKRLIEAADLNVATHELARNQGPGQISCLAAIRTAIRQRGEDLPGQALKLIGEAFPDEVLLSAGTMFGALVELLAVDRLDYDRLFQALLAATAAEWSDWSNVGGGGMSRQIEMRRAIRARYDHVDAAELLKAAE